MAQKRITARIAGRVQMVMFRDFASRKARGLGLTGFVKNDADGSVKVVAEGDEDVLKQFIELLREGPLFAKVENIMVDWEEPTFEFTSFEIIY
ncbi:hypothetical protein A3B05_00740 [Candidatus Giovannonibacteria bacterium RIFCSPLOWO2_01_FULL_43_160]|uniref:acylphosphatase n=2 Tax=Candidatus Giovannoniibacteriota TaxID=1752738 RepID=A0A1F5XYA1_9BACT|nr:MAG: hypothetical protein A2652_00040 [Candidatus Giovannonibacteria bacterium RIFCSPHIGHO2_01_FULL_43_140]OGF70523.1 MAG: hypothetical protein A3C76_00450 [Candidatus Giovannonibacteria bacterium RIFCSPHIGHO2_02_FULL_44_51]OGF72263.1 MAG: hypothetical protein A3E35_01740 [Candidatus Giovannonibacteria bacterium RIFCSPHIGHO2_12_FULL_44_22]OGF76542.1 MAG: hypothetical protein A3B05_00740 [Candidatus Giovannonibacteria bacterium RIFCSPLOWO2_01_FULL_43_160]OGF86142.1 MAG: hypothetical protein A